MTAVAVWILLTSPAKAGQFEERLQGMTTLVVSKWEGETKQGSAFLYSQLAPRDSDEKGPQWRAVMATWLVTNRHLLSKAHGGNELLPEEFSFHMRMVEESGLSWDAVSISREELRQRAKFHRDSSVDVAIVDVGDILLQRKLAGKPYIQWGGITDDELPGGDQVEIEVADEVLVVGYPRNFYDKVNLYPIVKSGVVASAWSRDFNGKPYFLVDARLFPGSSGSAVISRPIDFMVRDGQLFTSKAKRFVLLGIYSGEPVPQVISAQFQNLTIIEKQTIELGVVWHARLLDEIISEGVPLASN